MPSCDPAEARARFADARVAVLATVSESGSPHLVPVTFVLEPSVLVPSVLGPGVLEPRVPARSVLESGSVHGAASGARDIVWIAVDSKPKRPGPLRRHHNIRANPTVSLLVQHWDEEWSALWWVRADGVASIHETIAVTERVAGLLRAKYPQYSGIGSVDIGPPIIAVEVLTFRGWRARADGP